MGELRFYDTRGIEQNYLTEVPDSNVTGGLLITHRIAGAAGANANHDVVLRYKERVIDAYIVLTGAGVSSAIITVKNGSSAISDDMDASGAGSDTDIVRAGTIDDTYYEIDAGGTLRVTTATGSTAPGFICYVLCMRVA